ncbi:MAG: hypothetical protein LC768_13435 [Acidobacteria bacterium]|nr:hypothetical protein [Acidobacteriota bacterium]
MPPFLFDEPELFEPDDVLVSLAAFAPASTAPTIAPVAAPESAPVKTI